MENTFIFMCSWKKSAIYRVKISDRKIEPVIDLKELSPAFEWFGLAPDDSILVAHDISSQPIYSLDVVVAMTLDSGGAG